MADRKLYDNLFRVIKANSGEFGANDTVNTEILDLQIPRGYVARIRKVIFQPRAMSDEQVTNMDYQLYGALINDPDDENSYQIPTYTIDHDVICDFEWELHSLTTTSGAYIHDNKTFEIDFNEEMDVIAVRNLRFNALIHGSQLGTIKSQVDIKVYFTYEKVSTDLYMKLIGVA